MLAKVRSSAVKGIDAHMLEIEIDVSRRANPDVIVVGLPDTCVKESRERVRTALQNAGYDFPWNSKVTINLAPADVKKEGPFYDLPIAMGILTATEQVVDSLFEEYAVVGELALEGKVRAVKGALSMAMTCKAQGLKGLVLPKDNAAEAAVVQGLEIIPVATLEEAVGFFNDQSTIRPHKLDLSATFKRAASYDLDFADVKGQEHAKRALTVAAAGGHNILMIGPPGSGKTMLARRLPTILPELTLDESLETTRIHSIAGLLSAGAALLATRPFRSPHHTISNAGLVGGGAFPRPGEISLAHNGVLFLDELPEFDRKTLEVLRQPLEDGMVTIGRAAASITYPAEIMLVASMNPCPCGFHGHPRKRCTCAGPRVIAGYLSRVSGPLLDRIDIHIEVPAVMYADISARAEGDSSAKMREVVVRTRKTQADRFRGDKILINARMGSRQLKKHCVLEGEAEETLKSAMDSLALSGRAYTRILKLARTIADIEGEQAIDAAHVSEAIQYRSLDRGINA
ncbi:MAG: YifB family Mg chelatase-like AAA ATPase [Planctomycetota bacterium]|nr:YifB family Mg chelatase-like AAA ATPase [Planctomycetota bacterium]